MIKEALRQILPATRIKDQYIDLVSYAADAGFYYLVPQAVVQPVSESEIAALFQFSHQNQVPLVFRTGGTSLSGQSITDGILVDLSRFWNKVVVEQDGQRVRVQPGVTGAVVNAFLKKYRRKIGPDPSSISAAMMGGILSNNSSGMCCGVQLNAYHTTQFIRFILPDGKTYSTEFPADYIRFKTESADLYRELATIKENILSNPELLQKIRKKYQTKTTIGYSLNAFIDYSDPLDILAHLLIGAEGTLAFIAEAVLQTVPDYPFKSTALLYFPDIFEACQAIIPLTHAGALMVELMDRASLRAVENLDGMPDIVKTLPDSAAALLVEFQEESMEALQKRVGDFRDAAAHLSLITTPEFTTDPIAQDFLWKVRKGLFPAVGAVRASGTTVILEDIAFPVAQLGQAILDLQALFVKHNYSNAIIFGHAKDGNIHFVVTQSLNTEAEIARYDAFLREVVVLVVEKYAGTLKAEHGTGRNMAPYVETEWGGDAYEMIKKIKTIVDPQGLLNPGVIVNSDKLAHIKHLKELPTVEAEVDRCIECGYCEHKCPSRDLTTTPRRRIVVRRVLEKLKQNGDQKNYQLLLQQYQYAGLDTCAVDGLCATACPVDINTGDLVKRLRRENHSPAANRRAWWVARHFNKVEKLVRIGLQTGHAINAIGGAQTMTRISGRMKKWIPALPLWPEQMPQAPNLSVLKNLTGQNTPAKIVYFPSCISRAMGSYADQEKNIMETLVSICKKTNWDVIVPHPIAGQCCSQIFSSKGFLAAQQLTANKIIDLLWTTSQQGHWPIVLDASSCTYTLHHLRPALHPDNQQKFDQLTILDSIDFLHDFILPRTKPTLLAKDIVLHPVCSLQKMKTSEKLVKVARHFARSVEVPLLAGCCGMAGDRGFLFPELTASATQIETNEVKQKNYDGYYSTAITCEMAMTDAVKKNYLSILYLADEAIP